MMDTCGGGSAVLESAPADSDYFVDHFVSRYSIFQVWVVPVLVVTVLMQLLFLSASASAYTL